VIIFFAALISILYYFGIMQFVIRWIGGGLEKVTGISKVESLCAASNIFVGQSESPLVIRPYLAGLAPSQLFCVMTVGMAGVAGTILAAYASMGIRIDYLVAAAFMSAPGGILMAKLMMPDPPGMDLDAPVGAAAHDDGEGAPGQRDYGRQPRRADRRQAGGGGGCHGARLRRAGGAGQRLRRLAGRLSATRSSPSSRCSAMSSRPSFVLLARPTGRGAARGQPVRHQGGAQRIRLVHRPRPARDLAAHRRGGHLSRSAASPTSARSRSRWR
jgi:hypothetical protein